MQNAQSVHRPRRTLGVDTCVGFRLNTLVKRQKITVNPLHQVRAVLITLVYATLDNQRLFGFDLRVADNILQMPLNGVNPVLEIQVIFNRTFCVRIANRCIHIVRAVIIRHALRKNTITLSYKIHIYHDVIIPCLRMVTIAPKQLPYWSPKSPANDTPNSKFHACGTTFFTSSKKAVLCVRFGVL